jgi:hypothetical protein
VGQPWTDAERAKAVDVYVSTGNLGEAQRSVARPDDTQPGKNTIKSWAVKAGHDIEEITARSVAKTKAASEAASRKWADRRTTMIDEFGDIAAVALDQVLFFLAIGNPSSAKDAATTCGILVDKAQVLSGDATSVVRTPWDPEKVAAEALPRADQLRPLRSVG